MNSFIFVNRIMENHKDISCCETPQVNFKIGKKLKLYSSLFILVFGISFLPQLHSLNHSLISYISLIWWAVLLGLLIGGLIEYFIPTGFIYKYLGQKKFYFSIICSNARIFNERLLSWNSCNCNATL